jgi:hypothetical protein
LTDLRFGYIYLEFCLTKIFCNDQLARKSRILQKPHSLVTNTYIQQVGMKQKHFLQLRTVEITKTLKKQAWHMGSGQRLTVKKANQAT